MTEPKSKITKRYILQMKLTGKYYTAKPSWSGKGWTVDITKAKLYTSSGHCRNAKSSYLSYLPYKHLSQRERDKVMASERRRLFDEHYNILTVEVNLGIQVA